jgi:hypothetical protein
MGGKVDSGRGRTSRIREGVDVGRSGGAEHPGIFSQVVCTVVGE